MDSAQVPDRPHPTSAPKLYEVGHQRQVLSIFDFSKIGAELLACGRIARSVNATRTWTRNWSSSLSWILVGADPEPTPEPNPKPKPTTEPSITKHRFQNKSPPGWKKNDTIVTLNCLRP